MLTLRRVWVLQSGAAVVISKGELIMCSERIFEGEQIEGRRQRGGVSYTP